MRRGDPPWQLRMFGRTLKKKMRLKVLREVLGDVSGRRCLLVTCGDNNGAINYHLREHGGRWTFADCDPTSLPEMAALLAQSVVQIDPSALPFADAAFHCVVTIDVHEHLADPAAFTREVRRTLMPGGRAVVTVPGGDPRRLVNRLKQAVGMTREEYGHVRDGFSVAELESLLRVHGLEPCRAVTFSRFFTELIELGINFAYVKRLSKRGAGPEPPRSIAPATAGQLRSVDRAYRLYSLVYPVVWLVSQLDRLLFFTPGHVVLVEGARTGDAG